MTQVSPHAVHAALEDHHVAAHALAAEAFVVLHLARPALRLSGVSLVGGVQYESRVLPGAARLNRSLLEEQALVLAAGQAARELLAEDTGQATPTRPDPATEAWLQAGLNDDEAAEVASYARALHARTRGLLRAHWSEVSVLALGLQQTPTLSAHELRQRLNCVQGIRSTLLN